MPKSLRYPGLKQEVPLVAAINYLSAKLLMIRNDPGDREKAHGLLRDALAFAPDYALVLAEQRNLK